MLWAWLMLNGRVSLDRKEALIPHMRALRDQSVAPVAAFKAVSGGELRSQDLDAEGNDFVGYYYGSYCHNYDESLGLGDSAEERLPDTWETYKRVAVFVNSAYGQWIGDGRPSTRSETIARTVTTHRAARYVAWAVLAAVVVIGLIVFGLAR